VLDRLTDADGVFASPRYAHATVVTGRLAFVSGQVGMDADGRLVGEGDLAAQTTQALRNLHGVLRALGADWTDVVRFNWYLTDVTRIDELRGAIEAVTGPAFADRPRPASTLVGVAALLQPGFLMEVDAVVALPDQPS
jgi:enamine deaminase RidA (YjgF/YER057c/UK114 family)